MQVFAVLLRLQAVLDRHSESPYRHGRAAQLAGGALLANGLGRRNPLDGVRGIGTVVANLLLVGFCLLWLLVLRGAGAESQPYEDGLTAPGRVTSVEEVASGRNGGTQCSVTVQYTVAERTYTKSPRYSSSGLCDEQGKAVDVSYPAGAPEDGRPIFGRIERFGFLLIGWIGWAAFAAAVYVLLLRAAEIVLGAGLVLWGRRRVGTSRPEPTDALLAELRSAWAGPDETTAGAGEEATSRRTEP